MLASGGVVGWSVWNMPEPEPADGIGPLRTLLGGPAGSGFQRAIEPRTLQFPRDHGPHPVFKHEWWYVTGNLSAPAVNGRQPHQFGYQITLFRIALAPTAVERSSEWATSNVYMGHLALSDITGKRFHHFQRFSRAAAGLAGAVAEPFRVWLDDWSLSQNGGTPEKPDLKLTATAEGLKLKLNLRALKPVVLQGDRGLSQKSAEPGNASYYYSLPRLQSRGSVTIDDTTHAVAGTSWLDREWSTSALGREQEGWDWFALHLSDGWDLMYYQMRRRDRKPDPMSRGVLIDSRGTVQPIARREVTLTVRGQWTSPDTGVTYPSGWRLSLPNRQLELTVTPLLKDQELDRAAVRYWEGAVSIEGIHRGAAITGRGYTELAGYGVSTSP